MAAVFAEIEPPTFSVEPFSRQLLTLKWIEPDVIELLGRFGLTSRERRKIFDGHDGGDEDPRERTRWARWVCGLGERRRCDLDPGHFGPHQWQMSR